MVVISQVSSPVEEYYASLGSLRRWMRRYTPFTFIAYKTLVPSHSDDLIGLASKIGDFITLRFYVYFCVKVISPACTILPFLPFLLDFGWVMYHWLQGHQIAPLREEELPTQSRDRFSSLSLLIIGFSGVYLLNRHLPETIK